MPEYTFKRPLEGVEGSKDIKEPLLTTKEKKSLYEPKNRLKIHQGHWSRKIKEFDVDDYAIRVIDKLFIELKSIFSAHKQSWTSEDVINSAKANYLRCFNDRGIHQADKIKIGLDKAREKAKESPFLPTCAEFAQWCIDEDWKNFSKLSVEHAYQEACRNTHPSLKAQWTDIVSYNAYIKTGSDVIKNKPSNYSFKVFKENYQWSVDQIRANRVENLREIPVLIEKDTSEDRRLDRNKSLEHIENIRNMLRKAGRGM